MPPFPGEKEVPLPKGKKLVLRHRLWVHVEQASDEEISEAWKAYASPPLARVVEGAPR